MSGNIPEHVGKMLNRDVHVPISFCFLSPCLPAISHFLSWDTLLFILNQHLQIIGRAALHHDCCIGGEEFKTLHCALCQLHYSTVSYLNGLLGKHCLNGLCTPNLDLDYKRVANAAHLSQMCVVAVSLPCWQLVFQSKWHGGLKKCPTRLCIT